MYIQYPALANTPYFRLRDDFSFQHANKIWTDFLSIVFDTDNIQAANPQWWQIVYSMFAW